MGKKLLYRMNFDDEKDFVSRKVAIPNSDQFITEEEYDPNEPFSEFKFRSFKKDKQIRQDYALIDVDDPEEMVEMTASTIFPDT